MLAEFLPATTIIVTTLSLGMLGGCRVCTVTMETGDNVGHHTSNDPLMGAGKNTLQTVPTTASIQTRSFLYSIRRTATSRSLLVAKETS
jgi:hypothetical protein